MKRPDLLLERDFTEEERQLLEAILLNESRWINGGDRVYVALLHYPMYNKRMEIVAPLLPIWICTT